MSNKTKIILASFLVLGFFVISGCGCKQTVEKYTVDLEVWGILDDSDAYAEIFKNYKELNPNVGNIVYKKQRIETYEKDLIDALASGKGPDIFLIHNNWLPKFYNKIVSAPREILSEQRFRKDFVDVCADDFVVDSLVYAVPLSVDSLALYYNKDLFNAAGVTAPPKTWDEFAATAARMTRINANGEIVQSGAAMGTAYNINRSTDILNMLLLQNGVSMRNENGINFGKNEKAKEALEFYAGFAKNSSPNYTWNPTMHYSIDAFSEGTLAMMLNYSWQRNVVRNKAPKLNFALADVPQISPNSPANYANYWGFAVANNKTAVADPSGKIVPVSNEIRIQEAWKFLTYLTTKDGISISVPVSSATNVVKKPVGNNFDPAIDYLEKTDQPAARRDLVERQKSGVELGAFANGNLIAKSWSQTNPAAIESFFAEMIDSVNRGAATVESALSTAEERVRQVEGI